MAKKITTEKEALAAIKKGVWNIKNIPEKLLTEEMYLEVFKKN